MGNFSWALGRDTRVFQRNVIISLPVGSNSRPQHPLSFPDVGSVPLDPVRGIVVKIRCHGVTRALVVI